MVEHDPSTAAEAAIAEAIRQNVSKKQPTSKTCAAFNVGAVSSTLNVDTLALFVPTLRDGLLTLADTFHPNFYAELQHELDRLAKQYDFYWKDTGDPALALRYVTWNWLRVMDRAIATSHPYRKWYALGLAWGGVYRQLQDSPPVDLADFLHAVHAIGTEDLDKVPILKEFSRMEQPSGPPVEQCVETDAEMDTGAIYLKLTEDISRQLAVFPDVAASGDKPYRVRKGKAGRRPERDALAKFAGALRNRKPPMTWSDIAIEWQDQHPGDYLTGDAVRSAVRNFKRRRRPHRA
jgi:hypothetical protein